MKKFITIFIFVFTLQFTIAQIPNIEWAVSFGGEGNERANSVNADSQNNIIIVGRFRSKTIAFGKTILTKTAEDDEERADIFLAKLDSKGNTLWAFSTGGFGDDHGVSCVTDKDDNIYIVGWFESKSLKLGNITVNHTNYESGKNSDVLVAKFSPNGECLWAKNAGGKGSSGDYSNIAIDNQNNVIIAGAAGNIIDFGNGIKFMHEKRGNYIAKYTKDGNLIWAVSPIGNAEAQGMNLDNDGNIFLGGFFFSKIQFDTLTLKTKTDKDGDAFIAKYNPNGEIIWAKSFGGEDTEIASCETDKLGNVYLGGLFFSKIIAFGKDTLKNNGLINSFIAKYDTKGNLLWAKCAGGNNGDKPATATREFHIDVKGDVYCTGSNWSEFKFAAQTIKPVAASEDIVLLKYNTDGNEIWGVDYGGSGRNAGRGITTNNKGNILLTGSFDEKELKLGNYTLKNSGDSDIFIVKYEK